MRKVSEILLIVVVICLTVLGGNGLLMLVLGGLSHVFGVSKVALSFWHTFVIYIALGLIGGFFKK